MNWDFFLEKESLRKYHLLEYLDRYPNQVIENSLVQEKMEFSSYLFKTTVAEISDDIKNFGFTESFNIFLDETTILFSELKNVNSSIFLNKYLELSVQVDILKVFLLEENFSIVDFSDEYFSSYNFIYQRFKKIQKFFSEVDVELTKNGVLSGNESFIRNFYSQLFFRTNKSGDYYDPTIKVLAVQLFEKIETYKIETLTKHVTHRLEHFLSIVLTRLKKQHQIKLSKEEIDAYEGIAKENYELVRVLDTFFSDHFSLSPEDMKEEILFLCGFLYSEKIIEGDSSYFPSRVEKLANKFLSNFEENFSIVIDTPLRKVLFNKLLPIIIDTTLSNYKSYFLDSKTDLQYFKNSYPEYFYFCQKFVNENSSKKINVRQKSYFFYYALLILIRYLPISLIMPPIEVCVDFSFGDEYNEIIGRDLKFFSSLNVEIVPTVKKNTRIYLTDAPDFSVPDGVKKIVWLAPPRSEDWQQLVDELIILRNLS